VTATPDLLEAFLDDIVANPHDPSLWLILADWLDERDDPRAELVRLTWSLQHEPGRGFAQRQRRVQQLLAGGMVSIVPRRMLPPDFEFAWIPPGSFRMGSPPKEPRRERGERRRPVTIPRGFWMGVYPVTQGQWEAVMGDNPSAHSRGKSGARLTEVSEDELTRFPVESVPWPNAQRFCAKLAERVGQPIRLPTEEEWEYACRAGTTTSFSFGDDPKQYHEFALFSETGDPFDTHPDVVGRRKPNAWGLYDMHGNVCEWSDGHSRGFVRGGTYHFVWWHCRSAARAPRASTEGHSDTGFRICFNPA
jgi:uncharacterized protein (TIGR02996 family)